MRFHDFKAIIARKADEHNLSGWELYGIAGGNIKAGVNKEGDISLVENESLGVSLRVIVKGRSGIAFCEKLDEENADFLIKGAMVNAGLVENEGHAVIFAGAERYPELDNWDDRFTQREYIEGMAREIAGEVKALGARMEGIYGCSVTGTVKHVFFANANGVDLNHRFNYAYGLFFPTVSASHKSRETHMYFGRTKHHSPDIKELCRQAVATAQGYLQAQTPTTGTYNTVFRNYIASYLLQGFTIFFCGKHMQNGLSLFKDRLGQKVAAGALTIIDDPQHPAGLLGMPFDAQGVPAYPKTVVADGVLKTILHDLESARIMGGTPTGNSQRIAYNTEYETAPSNIYIKEGPYSQEQLFSMLGDGIYITELTAYFHGAGVNPVSGNFSLPAKGYRIKGGKIVGALELFMVAGNYYDLIKNIKACGNDLYFGHPFMLMPGAPAEYGTYGSPALLIEGVSVAGK